MKALGVKGFCSWPGYRGENESIRLRKSTPPFPASFSNLSAASTLNHDRLKRGSSLPASSYASIHGCVNKAAVYHDMIMSPTSVYLLSRLLVAEELHHLQPPWNVTRFGYCWQPASSTHHGLDARRDKVACNLVS
ncbi:hypothetical protein O6P43_017304 [Quillaja saponaria]|uniref:Uncharacterized protein n=1 Tax=Quillaja saponaria TaxID=32244 RepID=A0AAD7LQ26_QUISA|nr:hypothetical protein O6P43_017304 [Quillaja saponaria]